MTPQTETKTIDPRDFIIAARDNADSLVNMVKSALTTINVLTQENAELKKEIADLKQLEAQEDESVNT